MKKTIGGDRVGSGSKLKVNLKNYERSTHDLSRIWRSSMSSGTLVPFLSEVALPGDTFDINLDCDVKTHPTIGPLFGSYKVQLDVFQCPIRLYNSDLHNNKLGIGMSMQNVALPQIELTASPWLYVAGNDINSSQINPSCILNYLGIKGAGLTHLAATRQFNALPYLMYWDIFKNYYANKQEENAFVLHSVATTNIETVDEIVIKDYSGTPTTVPYFPASGNVFSNTGYQMIITYTGVPPHPDQIIFDTVEYGQQSAADLAGTFNDTGTALEGTSSGPLTIQRWRYTNEWDTQNGIPQLHSFPLANIDEMRTAILQNNGNVPLIIDKETGEPYNLPLLQPSPAEKGSALFSQEGLAIKTYQSDLFNNWISTEWIDGIGGISEITAIDTSEGNFTIDTLNLSRKVYDMLNRIAISGGTYDDWLDAVYTHERYTKCETPMYMGGLSKELIFQAVVNNSGSENQPLGTLAGKGSMSGKNKGGRVTIKVDEPSYIIGIVSLTPRIDYSQGNTWDTGLKTMNDLHKPALDEIGFQELITEQMAWWDTRYDIDESKWVTKSAGKQPAWINYMTAINTTHGNFALQNNEMFMTLNRRYENDEDNNEMKDLTTYIDPSKFNFIFAETAIDSQNFWVQIASDITARRKMSAKIMPNL